MTQDSLVDQMASLDVSGQASIPAAPPMPTSLPGGGSNGNPYARANGSSGSSSVNQNQNAQQKDVKDLSFEEQQMANLPSNLLTTALKPGTKKPFSYTPVGLSAADLKSPSTIRKEKLNGAGGASGNMFGPSHMRLFNGMRAPSESDLSEGGVSALPPVSSSRPHTPTLSVKSDDEGGHRRFRGDSVGPPQQSRSFRILQWMTGAEPDDGSTVSAPAAPQSHVEPDEMKSSGYRKPETIPSRSFQALDRFDNQPEMSTYSPPQMNSFQEPQFRSEFSEEEGPNLRYQGAAIPSRAFHTLHTITNRPHVQEIPDPNPNDFRYQGPQYSTYELPNRRALNVNPVLQQNNRPVYSSSVSLTPSPRSPYHGQQLSYQAYNNYGNGSPQNNFFPPQSPQIFQRQTGNPPIATANYYSQGTSDF